jgi:hypothetical protein
MISIAEGQYWVSGWCETGDMFDTRVKFPETVVARVITK